tara:strand:- start:109 stop:282 length:174 start_codon:yes stop_codon:yes gene_type:complete
MNKYLREFYLDYFNNYLTLKKLAEHHGLTVEHASLLVSMGKEAHERHCEMWHEIKAV